MGRTALLLVTGLGMAMGIISYNISSTTERALQNNYSFYKFMYARNLARTAIHSALRTYDNNKNPDTTKVVPFSGGTYQVLSAKSSGAPPDTLRMSVKGSYTDTSYMIKVTLRRDVSPFPDNITAAVGIRTTGVTFKNDGEPIIDGRNYTMDGVTLTGSGNKPAVATMTKADSTAMAAIIGFPQLQGSPSAPVKDTTTPNPIDFVDVYLKNADFSYTTGTYSNLTWGSAANPVIVDCYTKDTLETVTFNGNTEGWGILIVRGSAYFNDNFKFHGLVVVYGESGKITAESGGGSGGAQIIGAMIVASASSSLTIDLRGKGKFKYSSAAITNAKNIGKLLYYRIMDWYE